MCYVLLVNLWEVVMWSKNFWLESKLLVFKRTVSHSKAWRAYGKTASSMFISFGSVSIQPVWVNSRNTSLELPRYLLFIFVVIFGAMPYPPEDSSCRSNPHWSSPILDFFIRNHCYLTVWPINCFGLAFHIISLNVAYSFLVFSTICTSLLCTYAQ